MTPTSYILLVTKFNMSCINCFIIISHQYRSNITVVVDYFWNGSSDLKSSSQPPFPQAELESSVPTKATSKSYFQAKLSVIGLSLLPDAALRAGDSDSSGGEFNDVVNLSPSGIKKVVGFRFHAQSTW